MVYYQQLIYSLEQWGFTDVLLPFLLIFTILFATLQKVKVVGGEDRKKFNIVIALVMTLIVIIPHVTMGTADPFDGQLYNGLPDAVEIINNALPSVSILVVAVIMMLLLIGLFGGEARWMGGSLSGWIAIVAFLLIIWIFGGAAGWWRESTYNWFEYYFGPDTLSLVIIILVFAIIVWFIVREPTQQDRANFLGNMANEVGRFFGGGR